MLLNLFKKVSSQKKIEKGNHIYIFEMLVKIKV